MAMLGATFFGNGDEDDILQQKSLETKWYIWPIEVDRHSIGTPSAKT